jgi:hypothetical protein
MMFPKRAGGVGRKRITHRETVAELAKADPDSAWAFGLLSSFSASAEALPKKISETIFSTRKELVCSVASRTGTAKPCADGYEIFCSWPYVS